MTAFLALWLASAAATSPSDVIAPPLDVVLHQTSEEVRDDGRARRSFRIARDIVFAADPEGFRATVTLREATAEAPAEERARYRAANAPMVGRPVVIRLDRAGRLRSVDDLANVWAAWSSGLAATNPAGADPDADAMRARLKALPQDRTARMVGSMVTELIVPATERVAVPARPVSMASPAPFASVVLNGTGSAVIEDAQLRIRVVATGSAPAVSGRGAARIAVSADRLVDPATGLIVQSARSERITAPGLALTVTSSTRLTR